MTAFLIHGCLQTEEPSQPAVSVSRLQGAARVGAWWPDVAGFYQVDEGGVSGTRLRFDKNLGMDAHEGVGTYEITILPSAFDPPEFGDRGFRLFYTGHTWSASRVLTGEERFEGTTFPAGTSVRSTLQFDYFGLEAYAPVEMGSADGAYNIEAYLGLRYLTAELDLRSAVGSESEQAFSVVLAFGGRLDWRPVPFLTAGASLDLGIYSGFDVIEASAFVSVRCGPVSIEAAYRVLGWEAAPDRGEELSLVLAGPSLALAVRF